MAWLYPLIRQEITGYVDEADGLRDEAIRKIVSRCLKPTNLPNKLTHEPIIPP